MRKILCLAGLAIPALVFSQSNSLSDHPDWSVLMQSPDLNFPELSQQFEASWNGVEITPGCGWKPFKRWEWIAGNRLGANNAPPQGPDVIRTWEDVSSYHAMRSPEGNWQQLGPILDDFTDRDDIPGVGRMNFIAFHPTDPSIIFSGAPSGGLWRSYDGGQNWISNTDDFPTLGVSAVAFDPINPDVVYIGTGDRDAADAPGMGVMKSVDGGETWEFANAGIEGRTVGDLLVHPTESNIVYAATSGGVFRSEDGALTWEHVSNGANYKDLEFKPNDPSVVYAAAQGRFYRSTNNGTDFQYVPNGIVQGTRMVIAVTPADPERVYALTSSTYEFREMYLSTDGGMSFTEMSDSPNILGWSADGSETGGQAWYDLCMAADHENPDVVYVGGIRMKRSTDAGVTWEDINPGYLHVDQHHCAINPHDKDLYLANDGGVYHYIQNEEWLDISNGIVTGQIYKLGQSMHNPQRVLSGFQDNGTMEYLGSNWVRRGGGDGFECFYDPTDEEWRYGSIYYGNIYRTNPGQNNRQICGQDVNGVTESGGWVTPFTLSPQNENVLFVGLKNLWRTVNVKHENPDSVAWTQLSNNLGGNNNSNMVCVEPSKATPNIVYASEGSRKMFRADNAMGEPVWVDLSNNLPWLSVPVVDIESHPVDSNRVWISFGNKIYESTDRAETWTDISGTLPDVSINSIIYDFWSQDGLYIGTDMGIYFKDASMPDWVPFSNGFPLSVRVTELEIYYGATIADSRIRAATYGRGVWESDLYDSETYYFPSQAALATPGGETEFFGDISVNIGFYKNLGLVAVEGLSEEDIYVEGADIASLEGGPVVYTLNLNPTVNGQVKVFVGADVVTDELGMSNYAADTLFLVHSEFPASLGISGPGGVGDINSISLWLIADHEVLSGQGGSEVVNDEEQVGYWGDRIGNSTAAADQTDGQAPVLRIGENGISGLPAVEFNGSNTYLLAENTPTKRNFAAFSVVQGPESTFNEHGWIASAREANGFMLHPWKESMNFSANAYGAANNENMGATLSAGNVAEPHVYGAVFYDNGVNRRLATVLDRNVEWRTRNDAARDEEDQINIRIGRDFDDRFGAGKMGEMVHYTTRLFETHYTLIQNYFGARYLIDMGSRDFFHLDSLYRFELAGIGQENYFDFHHDAQGTGAVRMHSPSDINDGEYLIWAHDGSGLNWVEGGFPISSFRIEQTWGFEATGEPGEVTFTFVDESGVLPVGENIGLIVSDNESFMPGEDVEFIPLTVNGNVYTTNYVFSGTGVFTLGLTPSVSVQEASLDFSIYPNPVADFLSIDWKVIPNGSVRAEVLDLSGRLVQLSAVNAGRNRIDVSGLAAGSYFLRMQYGEVGITQPFIKN